MKRLTSSLVILIFCWLALPAVAFRIYIDPGHYVGDQRCDLEIETNLAVGLKLQALLKNDDTLPGVNWEVRMSRKDGKGIAGKGSLRRRAEDANNFEADLFISIHCNAQSLDCNADLPGTGTETFWCELNREGNLTLNRDESRQLAHLVQKHMVNRGKWDDRRVVEDHSYLGYHLSVLQFSEAPGCLNEIGFVDNANDRDKLRSDHWRNKFAEAYRDAIYEYFRLPLPVYLEVTLAEGWNAISVPGIPASSYPWSTIIRSDLLRAPMLKRWDPIDNKAKNVRRVKFGEAYWIHSSGDGKEKVHISYFPRDEYTIHLERGFNMIGSVSHTADFGKVINRSISRKLWTWDPRRNRLEVVPSDTIIPGRGYFVKASRPTELTVGIRAWAAPVHMHETIPRETQILANFPNPFNPETWIPYQLSKPAEVTVTIYATDGRMVRTLVLGHQPAGVYQGKNRAAYWDGRNALGEAVASGIYFYTLKAGDFTATRKMLIRK